MKEETGLNTKSNTSLDTEPGRSADLAKTGDVARLDRFRRRAKGQIGSAASHKAQDLSSNPHRAISSGDPDTSTHTSGHLDLKQAKGSNSYESDISHQEGRKEDQRMESMSTPSQAPLGIKERCLRDMKLKKELEIRKNPPKKRDEKEVLAFRIIKLWNSMAGLSNHKIQSPMSGVLKNSIKRIIEALKGKLVVDHPLCVENRKYNFYDFKRAIEEFCLIAQDSSQPLKAQEWAAKLTLPDFIINSRPSDKIEDKESKWYFYHLSPFMYLTDHKLEKKVLRSAGQGYDEKLINEVHDIISDLYDKVFPYNEENKKEVVKFVKYIDGFIKENNEGLAVDATIENISKEYCKFVFEENFNHKIGFLFFPNKHSEFFDYCLEVGILHDEYKGRLFKGGSKFFFQLTDAERKAIKSKEKKAKEEQKRISEERRIADEKQRKEELLRNPPKPYDAKEELEKKKRKQEVKSCTARKDEWRKKAKANGNAKEFDAIWFDWARETKIDPTKLDQLKQSIQHLL